MNHRQIHQTNRNKKGKIQFRYSTLRGEIDKGKAKALIFLCLLAIGVFLVTSAVPTRAHNPTHPNLAKNRWEVAQQVGKPLELLQQGRQLYEAGQFFEAANVWKQASEAYEAQGETYNQVQALNYLSSAYQNLGEMEQAQNTIAKSLNLLKNLPEIEQRGVGLLAQALNTQGSLQLARGETETALETWKQAEAAYDRAKNETGKLGSRINQTQALQSLGQYRRAKFLLLELVKELQTKPDSLLKAEGLRSLGVALQRSGDFLGAKQVLEQSWSISQKLKSPANISSALFSIGNVARDLQGYDIALGYYREAAKLAPNEISRVQAQLNELSLLVETKKWGEVVDLAPKIALKLSDISASRASVYARVNLAESLMKYEAIGMKDENWDTANFRRQTTQILVTAIQQARQLRDRRGEAYSLNELGKLYLQNQQWEDAKSLTEQALQIAQQIDAADIAARAAGDLGGILKQQQNTAGAIAAYRSAVENLQSLRSDLVTVNRNIQFDFKENVEPIYRELIGLLLQPNAQQAEIKEAREVIEALQLAELDNFFGDACLDTKPVMLEKIDRFAAVIHPIILSDRLEVILSLPNGQLRHYASPLTSDRVEATLKNLYSSLYPGYSNNERLRLSEQVYDWLIRPAEADLAANNIKTLVFVLDGFLRSLPMAALYDGKQYLIEKYSISLSPGLQLFPEGLPKGKLTILAAALTEARQGFTPLPGVQEELQKIKAEVNTSEVLINEEFTASSFQNKLNSKSFPIIHLATHGQFSSNAEETFLLTWNDRIGIKDFDLLFRSRKQGKLKPIELLVMSACQTAAGDNRAALGLAGFALRSGARSTLASLWSVNDESTSKLMSEFYHQLGQADRQVSKAEALRQAQLKLMHNPLNKHPYFWASFVLVGNWL